MALRFSTLSFGTRPDAATWESGCAGLGLTAGLSIRKGNPSLSEMATFFVDDAHWLFFGGHFGTMTLFNENNTTNAVFRTDNVLIKAGTATQRLERDTDFMLHRTAYIVLWGGCSVASSDQSIRILRRLFDSHVLLGFDGMTSWQLVNNVLAGGAVKAGFFDRLTASTVYDVDAVAKAWMEAAKDRYGRTANASKFRAIDWEGQEWKLSGNAIKKGRRFT
jgi:hypothetical protein